MIAGGLKALRDRRSFCSKLPSHPRQSLNLQTKTEPALLASEENGEVQAVSGQGL